MRTNLRGPAQSERYCRSADQRQDRMLVSGVAEAALPSEPDGQRSVSTGLTRHHRRGPL